MRGNLSEQDLTNYALNDGLDPRERLYVESMLGASDSCKEDVYKMIDMAQLLERGFEQEANRTIPALTRAQREKLLAHEPSPFQLLPFVRKTVATLSLAACVAFVAANQAGLFQEHKRTMAAVGSEVSRMVEGAMQSDVTSSDDLAIWVAPPIDEEESTFIQTSGDGSGMPGMPDDTICTPPTGSELTDTGESSER